MGRQGCKPKHAQAAAALPHGQRSSNLYPFFPPAHLAHFVQVNVFLEGNKNLPSLTPNSAGTSSGGGSGLSGGAIAGICIGGAWLGWSWWWHIRTHEPWSVWPRAAGDSRVRRCVHPAVHHPSLQPCWVRRRWQWLGSGPSSGAASSAPRRRAPPASSTGAPVPATGWEGWLAHRVRLGFAGPTNECQGMEIKCCRNEQLGLLICPFGE